MYIPVAKVFVSVPSGKFTYDGINGVNGINYRTSSVYPNTLEYSKYGDISRGATRVGSKEKVSIATKASQRCKEGPKIKPCLKRDGKCESRKKTVKFSDQLERVRHFLLSQEPLKCRKEPVIDDDYDDEDGDKDEYEKEAKAREGVKDKKENLIKFVKIDGPSGHSEFLETRKVALEQVRYEDKKRVIQGEIKVLNIQFEKNVTVRYTLDAWRSSSDINAEFTKVEQKSTQNFPGVDLFTFKIDTGVICQSAIDKLCCVEIEMCVRYKVENMEYWDNNNGRNYSFKITALSSGLDSSNGLCVRKVETKATASKLSEILRGKAELPPINKNIGILTAPKSLSFAQPQNDDIRIRLVQYRTPGSDAHVQNTFASHASHRPSSSVSNYPFSWDSYYKKASYTQHPRSNSNSPPAVINYSSTPRRMASQSYGPMGMGSEIIRCGSPSVLGSSPILTFSNIYSTTPLAGSPQTSRPGSPVVISRSSSTESMLAWVDGEPYSSSPLHEMPKLIC